MTGTSMPLRPSSFRMGTSDDLLVFYLPDADDWNAYGTWSEASMEEALQWLLPGARQVSHRSSIYGGLDFPKPGRG